MKKRVYVSLILGITISSFGWGIGHLNGIQQEIKTNRQQMEGLEIELEETQEAFKSVEEENQGLKEKLDSAVQQKEDLQKQIDDMMKKVSLNTQDVSQPSGVTLYHMKKALKGTTMEYLADAFVDAEKTYGVNAFFMAGVVALESGWATAPRGYNGTNNLTGHGVYNDTSVGTTFDSHYESVMVTARDIKRDYLTPGGQWNNGLSIAGVNVKYSASPTWKDKVAEIAFNLLYKANN